MTIKQIDFYHFYLSCMIQYCIVLALYGMGSKKRKPNQVEILGMSISPMKLLQLDVHMVLDLCISRHTPAPKHSTELRDYVHVERLRLCHQFDVSQSFDTTCLLSLETNLSMSPHQWQFWYHPAKWPLVPEPWTALSGSPTFSPH